MEEFQRIETFLLKDILQIVLKKFLLLAQLKIQFCGRTYVTNDLKGEENIGRFHENCKKPVKTNLNRKSK